MMVVSETQKGSDYMACMARKLLTAFVGEPDRFAAGASYNQGKYIRILRGGHNQLNRKEMFRPWLKES